MKKKAPLIILAILTTIVLTFVAVFLLITLFEYDYSKKNTISANSNLVSSEVYSESILPEVSNNSSSSDLSQSETSSTLTSEKTSSDTSSDKPSSIPSSSSVVTSSATTSSKPTSVATSTTPAKPVSTPSSSESPQDNGIRLVITSPTSNKVNTTEAVFTFKGTSDPAKPLLLNGVAVNRNAAGEFTYTANLKIGDNKFTFSHKGQSYYYTVNYRYVVINYYNPKGDASYDGDFQMPVAVTARNGSQVTATFNGATVTLSPATSNSEAFINYTGSFKLPASGLKDQNLGKIVFKATHQGVTESFSSGNIICKKSSAIAEKNPAATPTGGRYIDVGSGRIAEVIMYEAETFDAYSINDWSKPTNNYLPKGTVDYCSSKYVYSDNEEPKEYAVLRYGKQVYTYRKDSPHKEKIPVIKEYAGTLPDHNEVNIVSFSNGTRHTTLTIKPMWKAPFYLEVLPQKYNNVAIRDYSFSSATYSYIDITLCYTTVLTGAITIPADNPVFRSAEIIKNKSDYTLRLHLKKTGFFYGWDANYNDKGELVFEFLNPAKIKSASNDYKADLTGVSILIDVGHGGKDPGALGADLNHTEAIQNLNLAKLLKAELQSIGATVTLTRESNVTSSFDDKIKKLKALKPDYCIAIHHNASGTNKSKSGFSAHFFHPYSKMPADKVFAFSANTGLYKENEINWHRYFMARTYYCPVVLTENGYMSNAYDYSIITNTNQNITKAKALTKGIVSYFFAIY